MKRLVDSDWPHYARIDSIPDKALPSVAKVGFSRPGAMFLALYDMFGAAGGCRIAGFGGFPADFADNEKTASGVCISFRGDVLPPMLIFNEEQGFGRRETIRH